MDDRIPRKTSSIVRGDLLSPIAANAPRWVVEGYATYVEGRVTGSGRPNHAYRAAILRQFALEGRLPGYGQLNGGSGWVYGSFAYLAGSAFFEWLALMPAAAR